MNKTNKDLFLELIIIVLTLFLVEYGFNTVIAPIFDIAKIKSIQALGLIFVLVAYKVIYGYVISGKLNTPAVLDNKFSTEDKVKQMFALILSILGFILINFISKL